MILAEKPQALEQYKEFGSGVPVETITRMWSTATGWLDVWMWGVLLGMFLLIGGSYLITLGRRTKT